MQFGNTAFSLFIGRVSSEAKDKTLLMKKFPVWKGTEFIQITRKAELGQTKVHLVPLAKLIKGELQCFADCQA